MQHNRRDLLLRDEGFRILYEHEKSKLSGAEEVIAMLDREGIDRAVIFGFPWQDVDLCKEGNDYVLESMIKFPDRFIGFITVPWSGSEKVIRECERGIASGAQGVGELALYHQPHNHRVLLQGEPLVHLIEQKGVPLLLHINEPVGHSYAGKMDVDFKALQDFIAAYPDLTIILAHWGGGFFFFELMPEIKKITKNVFYDTAASPLLYHQKIFEVALNIVGEERILFGSDFPLLTPRKYFKEMAMTIASEDILKKIKGENAKRLFKL
jgi:predicted TIM-barrel fold metal-dependent hydrolase